METTEKMELRDENVYPDEKVLEGILGDSFSAYRELLKLFDTYELNYAWRFYKDGNAWLGKVQKKDRTIVWMSAWKGYLKASIHIPVKYVDQFFALDISEEVKENLRNDTSTGKLKPSIFKLRTAQIPDDFIKVMRFKMSIK